MNVFEWNSYSCNNSSSYRMVAQFATHKRALEMGKELDEFFAKHAIQFDHISDQDGWSYPGPPTPAAVAFGQKYGVRWSDYLGWGDCELVGDEPELKVLGNTVVMYHGYMSGFGTDLEPVLLSAGATEVQQDDETIWVYCEFILPDNDQVDLIQEEIASTFAQADPEREMELDSWEVPWTKTNDELWVDVEDIVHHTSGRQCAFLFPVTFEGLDDLEIWLKGLGVTSSLIRLRQPSDLQKIKDKKFTLDLSQVEAATPLNPVGLSFLFTGKLRSMTRASAKTKVEDLGGTNAKSVTKNLDVLVIGDEGSVLYGEGDKGSKQVKAEALNDKGASIRIMSETDFLKLT